MSVDMRHIALGDGAEFDAIRELLDEWGELATGIGDDAAVLAHPRSADGDLRWVVSTDACVETVHFRAEWISPQEVGARATAAALSDLAAMGAQARSVLVSLTVPPSWQPQLRAVARGIGAVVRAAGARIVGGNISTAAQFGITTTVIGVATSPVLRSSAAPGDRLFVTGALGGPGAAIAAWTSGATPSPWMRERFAAPRARLEEGAWLAAEGASAMIDVSDGLLADAGHLARASGVDILLDGERIPVGEGVTLAEALGGGDEYELLVALPARDASTIAAAFRARFPLALTEIGTVRPASAGRGEVQLGNRDGGIGQKAVSRVELRPGHDHFSR